MVTRLARNPESFAGNFGILERPIGRREGNAPEMGSGLDKIEIDFDFSIGIGVAKGDAASWLLSSFGILTTMTCPRVTGRFKLISAPWALTTTVFVLS